MAEPTGLAAIAQELAAGEQLAEELAASQAEQLSLLGLSVPAETLRKPGRPPGRRNLRNQRVADYLLQKHGDPLEQMAALVAMPFDVFCAAFGCSKMDALAEKRLIAGTILPYLHQRQPLAVDLTNRNIVHLTIAGGEAATASMPGSPVIMGELAEVVESVEIQSVSESGTNDV